MTVSMDDVRRILDPEEPDYDAAAELGTGALPHLQAIVAGDDPMLASKAAYAASMLEGDAGQDVVQAAAHSTEPLVRVAAAAAARNLPAPSARDVLSDLAADDDPGVRKVARASSPDSS
jgi:HEAT repeat protein